MSAARLIALAALFLACVPALAASYRTYVNERFGTRIDIPQGWRPGPEPENGDGRKFTSPDNQASITASAMFHVEDTIDEAIKSRLEPEPGENVTYKQRGSHSVTASGTHGREIFFRKSILACGGQIWHTVAITYPATEKADYDAIVSHVAGSLRQGKAAGGPRCE